MGITAFKKSDSDQLPLKEVEAPLSSTFENGFLSFFA